MDAALERYAAVGPAATTITAVADAAGVERLTVYRHFPDEPALVEAAVQRLLQQHPLPDWQAWFAERTPPIRLELGLRSLAAFYRAAGPALGRLLRDREAVGPVGPALAPLLEPLDELPSALAEGWPTYGDRGRDRLRTTIRHALAHETWRSLTEDGRLADDEAVEVLVRLVTVTARPDS